MNDRTPTLRLAETADAERVFAWRNDPWIVSLSSSGRGVTRAEHEAWFARALDRDRHLFFVVEVEGAGAGAGIVRLERRDDDRRTAALSAYLNRPWVGRGLGPPAIGAACREAFDRWAELETVRIVVREQNERGRRAFERVGFECCPTDVPGHVGMRLGRREFGGRTAGNDRRHLSGDAA